MARACFLLKVKQDLLEQYLCAHDDVWPELLQAMREVGIRNYSLFHRDDGLIVGYLEADDPRRALEQLDENFPISRQWEAKMAHFAEDPTHGLTATGSGVKWLQSYFHME